MYGNGLGTEPLRRGNKNNNNNKTSSQSTYQQEILRANASIKIASDLAMKYRKNVQYNLEANKPREDKSMEE